MPGITLVGQSKAMFPILAAAWFGSVQFFFRLALVSWVLILIEGKSLDGHAQQQRRMGSDIVVEHCVCVYVCVCKGGGPLSGNPFFRTALRLRLL